MSVIIFHPTLGAPDGFPFAENHVRAQLGWSKDEIRAARKSQLVLSDFTRHKKRVFLTAQAAAKLAGAVSVQKTARARPGSISDDSAPLLRSLKVCRINVPNPRLVLACPEDEDPDHPRTILRVRIKPGTTLLRREPIVVRAVPPYTDLFDLIPQRNGHRRRST